MSLEKTYQLNIIKYISYLKILSDLFFFKKILFYDIKCFIYLKDKIKNLVSERLCKFLIVFAF